MNCFYGNKRQRRYNSNMVLVRYKKHLHVCTFIKKLTYQNKLWLMSYGTIIVQETIVTKNKKNNSKSNQRSNKNEQTYVSVYSISMLSLRYTKYISYFIKNTCSANTLYMNHIETGSKKTKGKKQAHMCTCDDCRQNKTIKQTTNNTNYHLELQSHS